MFGNLIRTLIIVIGISPPHISASIGGCSASINQDACGLLYDADLSSAWESELPSWIMLHLNYPTTINLIAIHLGDPPCTEFSIQLEQDGGLVEPHNMTLDIPNYFLKENLLRVPLSESAVEIRLMTETSITGVKLHFSTPSSCKVGDIFLGYSTKDSQPWSKETTPGIVSGVISIFCIILPRLSFLLVITGWEVLQILH